MFKVNLGYWRLYDLQNFRPTVNSLRFYWLRKKSKNRYFLLSNNEFTNILFVSKCDWNIFLAVDANWLNLILGYKAISYFYEISMYANHKYTLMFMRYKLNDDISIENFLCNDYEGWKSFNFVLLIWVGAEKYERVQKICIVKFVPSNGDGSRTFTHLLGDIHL